MTLIIGLIIIGIVLLVLEILVLPGMIAGILGGIFLLTGIVWMYSEEGNTAGHITLAATFVLTFVAIYWSLKSRAWARFGLKSSIDSRVNDVTLLSFREGDEGRSVSALRPSGTVEIDSKRVEAQTNGEMIDAGTKVVITKVMPNKVIVRIKTTEL